MPGPWLTGAVTGEPWAIDGRLPERLDAGSVALERSAERHRHPLREAVNESIDELRPWMPWAQHPATDDSVRAYLRDADDQWDAGTSCNYIIVAGDGTVVGGCGVHARRGPGVLEIGYWVRTAATGRGVAGAAAGALLAAALALPEVARVEIRCDAANERSAAVARRLGFRLDGRLAQPPAAPGESGEHLVFALDADDYLLPSMRGRA
jgi:RimJ/RimL family protein N-acetyltransferase